MTARREFAFLESDRGTVSAEARAANALEFIAHYLDRIDRHLEQLTVSVSQGAGVEKLRLELIAIQGALEQRR